MSLCTDQLFYSALKNDAVVNEKVGGRIFNPARDEEAEKEDRIPYIIITNEGTVNEEGTKDDNYESDDDTDTVHVLVVADNRDALADLMSIIRPCIKKACMEQDDDTEAEFGFYIKGYHFSASRVELDPSRPCDFQTLIYQCETLNIE